MAKRVDVSEDMLAKIQAMLETARAIVEALEVGESVETMADADAAIETALQFCGELQDQSVEPPSHFG